MLLIWKGSYMQVAFFLPSFHRLPLLQMFLLAHRPVTVNNRNEKTLNYLLVSQRQQIDIYFVKSRPVEDFHHLPAVCIVLLQDITVQLFQ